jgi:lipopolysaccharide/colanic/teichoic acid biosynthesis glycosyltransferase
MNWSRRALAVERRPLPDVQARAEESTPHYGKVYVVPARDVVATSGWLAEAAYRAFEILAALIGFVLGLPLMLIAAALIYCDSPGPVLFFHRRPALSAKMRGRDLEGRTGLSPPPGGFKADSLYFVPRYFTLVKFRGMYIDARARFPEFYAHNYTQEEFRQRFSHIPNDPRITRVGAILRKLSVDELPNLWSVLVGDMRLVGPRPENPQVLQYYTPEEMYKFACKPGITGLAQINGRGLLNWGETLRWDLEYVRTRSVAMDLRILLTTFKHLITRHGAF